MKTAGPHTPFIGQTHVDYTVGTVASFVPNPWSKAFSMAAVAAGEAYAWLSLGLDCIAYEFDGYCQANFWVSYGITFSVALATYGSPIGGGLVGLAGNVLGDTLMARPQ